MPTDIYNTNSSIYRITNITNGKFYIGQTKYPIRKRFNDHVAAAKSNSTYHLHRAIRKYGAENFTVELVESLQNQSQLNERERYWIATLTPQYNMTSGGEGSDYWKGKSFSEEHRRKIGEAGKQWQRSPMSDTQKQQLREANLGKKASNDTKLKMSITRKGVPHSPEHRAKLAAQCTARNKARANSARKNEREQT